MVIARYLSKVMYVALLALPTAPARGQVVSTDSLALVALYNSSGDPRSDRLKDADAISYFDVNLPLYYARAGRQETLQRCIWGYQRLSASMRNVVENIFPENVALNALLGQEIREAGIGVETVNGVINENLER